MSMFVRLMRHRVDCLRLLVICLLIGLPIARARAAAIGPCENPVVFEGTPVQVFILPYSGQGELIGPARALVNVLQRQVLYSALKYPSIGVVQLQGNALFCRPDRVTSEVRSRLTTGQTALFLSGRLFEQSSVVYLQSNVSVMHQGPPDSLTLGLGTVSNPTVSSATPTEAVRFAPRAIPVQVLGQLQATNDRTMRLFDEPSPDAHSVPLNVGTSDRFAYFVVGARDAWMHVQLLPAGGTYWLSVPSLESNQDAARLFPELLFVDALVGYQHLANQSHAEAAGSAGILKYVSFDLGHYLELTVRSPELEARSLAEILQGNAVLWATGTDSKSLGEARDHYDRARTIAPSYTPAASFYLAASSALCSRGVCPGGAERLHSEYTDALARDPTSGEIMSNLLAVYQVAGSGRLTLGLSRDDIASQVTVLQAALSGKSRSN
jgi:hypothetical protein